MATLERTGALVLTASLPDPGLLLRIPGSLRRPLARRAHAINGVLGRLAERYQVVYVDVAAQPGHLRQADVGRGPAAPQRARAPAAGPAVRRAAGRAGHAAARHARPGAGQPGTERLGAGALDGDQGHRLDRPAVPGPGAPAAPAGRQRMVARPARRAGGPGQDEHQHPHRAGLGRRGGSGRLLVRAAGRGVPGRCVRPARLPRARSRAPADLPHPAGQRRGRAGARRRADRAELRLVDRQAQPAPRASQPARPRSRPEHRGDRVHRPPGRGPPRPAPAARPLPGLPVLPCSCWRR